MSPKFLLFLLLPMLASLNGCGRLIATHFAASVQKTMERQNDIDLLYQGIPALLLLEESMLPAETASETLLLAATRGESGYAEILETYGEEKRARLHARKGAQYACLLLNRSLCLPDACTSPLPALQAALTDIGEDTVPALFWSASALGTSMRLEKGSPQSLILMPKVLAIMDRLLVVAPTFYHGGPHLFLGYYYGSLPVMLGGRPQESKQHFERALEITERRFLLAQVLYAESYARQTLNRGLFENLLNEVLDADIDDAATLSANALARKKARLLLHRADEFF